MLGWLNSWDANKVQILKEGNACVTFSRFKDAILTQLLSRKLMHPLSTSVKRISPKKEHSLIIYLHMCDSKAVGCFSFVEYQSRRLSKCLSSFLPYNERDWGLSECKKNKKRTIKHHKSGPYEPCTKFEVFWIHYDHFVWNKQNWSLCSLTNLTTMSHSFLLWGK